MAELAALGYRDRDRPVQLALPLPGQVDLRHKSATMTLDPYGHLFDDRLDEVAGALDAAARATRQRPSIAGAGGQLIKLPAAEAEPSS